MTTRITSNNAADSTIAHVLLDEQGAVARIDVYRDGTREPSLKPSQPDWQAQLVGLAADLMAVQVSTPAGAARHMNRLAGGALRAAAPNGRYWRGKDIVG